MFWLLTFFASPNVAWSMEVRIFGGYTGVAWIAVFFFFFGIINPED